MVIKILMPVLLVLAFGLSVKAQSAFALPVNPTDCSIFFFKAIIDKDVKALGNVLSDDFSMTAHEGQAIDRNLLINAISGGYLSVDSGILSATRTRDYGNVGVITGIWNAKGSFQNRSFQNELTYTLVCAKSGGNWKVSVIQFTPIR